MRQGSSAYRASDISEGSPPNRMHVTQLQASDLPSYRALMLHAYTAAADAFTTTAEERSAEPDSWWLNRIADRGGLSIAFGAYEAGELVGTVTIEFAKKRRTRHKAHLIGMFVSEPARGRGAGRLLTAGREWETEKPQELFEP